MAKTKKCEPELSVVGFSPLPLACGGPLQVEKLCADEERKKQLESLGFVPGAPVRVVTALGQNLIVEVKGSRIALDGRLTQKIYVKPL